MAAATRKSKPPVPPTDSGSQTSSPPISERGRAAGGGNATIFAPAILNRIALKVNKSADELDASDYQRVTSLNLSRTQVRDVSSLSGIEGLTIYGVGDNHASSGR